jgi:hypothetical protein
MKRAIHIYIIYLLALAFVPCGDGGGGLVEVANHLFGTEPISATDHNHSHSNDCGDDLCAPFCICSCCSIAVDAPVELSMELDIPLLPERTSPASISNKLFSIYKHSIWQPPRFS